MSVPGMRIAVDEVSVNVHIRGDGPPVLLLHGFPDTSTVWRHQVPALAGAGYHVLAPDLPGYGDSDIPRSPDAYRVDTLVDALVTVLDGCGITSASVVGHDWGAVLAWRLATRHPDRVDRLVALSVGHPVAWAGSGLQQRLRSSYVLFFATPVLAEKSLSARDFWLFRQLMRDETEFPLWHAQLSRPGRLEAALGLYRANLDLPRLGGWTPLPMPVMGLWGEGDPALTETQMTQSAQLARGGWRYERVPDAGHWLQRTRPDEVNALLLDFLGTPAG